MSDVPISLSSSGPPETVLDPEPTEALTSLARALAAADSERRALISAVVARWPQFLEGWARLGQEARDTVEAYACFRVGYHRGLDRLRHSGWRGSGFVRWNHPHNRGFLLALAGLARTAAELGEWEEAQRCEHFLASTGSPLAPGGVRFLARRRRISAAPFSPAAAAGGRVTTRPSSRSRAVPSPRSPAARSLRPARSRCSASAATRPAWPHWGFTAIPDDTAGQGPLGGLLTALRVATADWVAVLATDLPHASA